jgi:hypothetical protein
LPIQPDREGASTEKEQQGRPSPETAAPDVVTRVVEVASHFSVFIMDTGA